MELLYYLGAKLKVFGHAEFALREGNDCEMVDFHFSYLVHMVGCSERALNWRWLKANFSKARAGTYWEEQCFSTRWKLNGYGISIYSLNIPRSHNNYNAHVTL